MMDVPCLVTTNHKESKRNDERSNTQQHKETNHRHTDPSTVWSWVNPVWIKPPDHLFMFGHVPP